MFVVVALKKSIKRKLGCKKIDLKRNILTFFDLMTLQWLMVSALNLVYRRFIKLEKGRLTFGCPNN